jgi:circadian clock protein KaiB
MTRSDDKVAAFDRALAEAPRQKVELQLFIAGMGPRSTRAVAHAKELCKLLGERCSFQVVDIYEHPGAARASQVVAVPALVRSSPKPVRKLIGAIGNTLDTARSLGLLSPAQESSI